MKNKGKQPVPAGPMDEAPAGHDPAPDLQRDVRGGSSHRRRVSIGVSARAARDPGPRRFDRRDARRGRTGGAAQRGEGHRHHLSPSNRSHRLQGWRARGRHEGRQGRVHRHLRCGLHPDRGLPQPDGAVLRRSADRDGPGALGTHQSGLLAAHEDPGDPARWSLRARARRAQSRGLLLQLQRHGRHLASRSDRRCGWLAARHADRGSRPQLPCAAPRLAVCLPAGSDRARPKSRWR